MDKKIDFKEADKRFDKIIEKEKSNIELRKKTFMKISDVDTDDATWFKGYCDKHFDKKQFMGIKFMRQIIERIDPLVTNIVNQLNEFNSRICLIENSLNQEEESTKIQLPQTQGSKK